MRYLKGYSPREHIKKDHRVLMLGSTTRSGISEPFPRQALLLGMCDKCEEIDKRIEHYSLILLSINDLLTVEGLLALIAELRAQKGALHPEEKQ